VPFEKLAPQIPHEIENCQLESLVLQAIAAGLKFSHLNRKLMVKAPDAHVEQAIEKLKYLGLLGSTGWITELGSAVAELPTEVRTGKALALACRYSEKCGLSPEELVLPMIDLVACVEAKGIVTWESAGAPY
jgi:HrpA-like RNA helicase